MTRTLLLLASAGLALRVFRLGQWSYWLDEVRTLFAAQLPIGPAMLEATHAPPLYSFLLHFLIRLGTDEFLLRLPSALLGVASIPFFFTLGRRLIGERPALTATILFTFSPFHLWYSQEVGYYSLVLFLYLVSFELSFRFLETGRWRSLVGYAFTIGAALWVQYTTVFVILVQNFILIWELRQDRRRLSAWLFCQVLVGFCFALPLYLTHFLPALEIWEGTSRPFYLTLRPQTDLFLAVPYAFYTFVLGQSFGPAVSSLRSQPAAVALSGHVPGVAAAALVFGAIAFAGVVQAFRRRDKQMSYLLIFLLVPILCSLLFSARLGIPLNPRYLIGSYAPFLLLLGLGWIGVPARWWLRKALAAAVLILVAWSLYGYFFNPAYSREDARSAARYLEANVQAEDRVIVLSSYFALYPMAYYYSDGRDFSWFSPNHKVEPNDVAAMLDERNDARVLWLVLSRQWENDPGGLVRKGLDEVRRDCGRADFPGVAVIAYCSDTATQRKRAD